MKRFLIVALLASSLGAIGAGTAAQAGCTPENRGGSVGPYDTAGVTYGNIEVTAWTYGNFATGATSVCSDGDINTDQARGDFTIKVDGEVVCTSNDPAFRITADPFGFGASITGTGDDCAVAISFDGITGTPGAGKNLKADTEGAFAGVQKDAPVKNHGEGGTGPSSVTIGGVETVIPNGTMGYFTKGAGGRSEH